MHTDYYLQFSKCFLHSIKYDNIKYLPTSEKAISLNFFKSFNKVKLKYMFEQNLLTYILNISNQYNIKGECNF